MRLPTPRGGARTAEGPGAGPCPPGLDRLNTATAAEAEAALHGCCGSRRWAGRITAHRPYPDLPTLLAAADEASYDLTPEDLAEALAAEAAADGPFAAHGGAAAVHSGAAPYDRPGALAAHTALRAAHAAYESRFGHTFLICLHDFPPGERLDQMLAGIRLRLGNEPEAEREIAADELRRIARVRLTRLLGRPPEPGPCGVND